MLRRTADPTAEVFGVIRGSGSAGARAVVSHLFGRSLDALLVFWLFVTNGAVFPLLASDPSGELSSANRALLRIFIAMAFVLMVTLIAVYPRRLLNALLAWPLLVLVMAWVMASITWSVDPPLSAQRGFAFVTYSILPILISFRFGPERFIRAIATVFTVQLLLSLAVVIAVPRLGWMPQGDAARGIFLHKNVLGELLVLASVALFVAWTGRLLPRPMLLAGILSIPVLMVLANSATAIMLVTALAAIITVNALAKLGRPAPVALSLGLALACSVGIILVYWPTLIFDLLGRDPTLTGRVNLWTYVLGLIAERPFLGYGFRAAFEQPWVYLYLDNAFGWDAPNAHNGYLECILDLGIIGLTLTLGFLLAQLVGGARHLIATGHPSAWFLVLLAVIFLLRNLVESDLLLQTNLSWVLLIITAQHVRQMRRAER